MEETPTTAEPTASISESPFGRPYEDAFCDLVEQYQEIYNCHTDAWGDSHTNERWMNEQKTILLRMQLQIATVLTELGV